MKMHVKILCLFFLLFFKTVAFAQIFVSTNSYAYANNTVLYSKQYINISNDANVYLRNGAQLVQGTVGASQNTGTGKLSVFQEGTVDNFEHNYWCSPIGKATASVTGNESFGITMLGSPTSVTATTPALMGSTYDGIASPLTISQGWIQKFITSTVYSQWVVVGAASTINPGEGFTMKGTAGTDTSFYEGTVANNPGGAQRYDFRGKPNTGDIAVVVANGQSTLTGNPYPSAINLRNFLRTSENPSAINCTGIAYFWEQDKAINSHYLVDYRGGYGAYAAGLNIYQKPAFFASDGAGNPILGSYGMGNDYPREFSPIGQGFMIEGTANGTVVMQDKFRIFKKEGSESHFDKNIMPENVINTAPAPYIRINAKLGNLGVRQVTLAFDPEATDGIDHGMDASNAGNLVDMFFVIDDLEFMIEAVQFDIHKKIPIGFKNTAPTTFKMTVSEIMNFDESQEIFVHNKADNTYHDIKNGIYEVLLPEGVNMTQFEICFEAKTLGTSEVDVKDFDVVQNNDLQQLVISNPKNNAVTAVQLFDMAGKLIFDAFDPVIKERYQFTTSGISDGVYIVKIQSSDKQFYSKKVTIRNHK